MKYHEFLRLMKENGIQEDDELNLHLEPANTHVTVSTTILYSLQSGVAPKRMIRVHGEGPAS